MRTLLIGAASALALMAGTAVAQTGGSMSGGTSANPTVPDTTSSPSSGLITSGPGSRRGNVTTPGTMNTMPGSGLSGSSGMTGGTMGSGSSSGSWQGQTTTPSGMGNATSSNPARDNQTATGTHCPPGTPDCGPDGSQ